METEKSTQNNGGPTGATSAPAQPVNVQPTQAQSEYKGWLNSNSFLKRAFAIWGYHFVANFIIGIIMSLVLLPLFAIIGISIFSKITSSMKDFGSEGGFQFNLEALMNEEGVNE